jgi:hypothetical protein
MSKNTNFKLGEPEWRALLGQTFDVQVTKLRCRGYPVPRGGSEIGFVCLRRGVWYVLRPMGNEVLQEFKTRQTAIDSLFEKA